MVNANVGLRIRRIRSLGTWLRFSVRAYLVFCDEHGAMTRDEPRLIWRCIEGCPRAFSDEAVYRLVAELPDDGYYPLPIIVT